MPGMTGLELLPKAKALRPDVPIIMITAYGDGETKRSAGWRCRGAADQANRLCGTPQQNRHTDRPRRLIPPEPPDTPLLFMARHDWTGGAIDPIGVKS